MAYPVYQSNGGIGTGTAYEVVVDYPSTVNADDILIACIMDADNDTFDTPFGWTKIYEDGTVNNCSVAFYWKRADGTETGSVTFTSLLNAGSLVAGIMYRYSGCIKTGVPFEEKAQYAVTQATSQVIGWGAMFPANGTDRLAVAFNIVEDNTISGFSGTGWTEDSRLSTSVGGDAHFAAASEEFTTYGSVATWTSGNEYNGGLGLYLLPEPEIDVTLNTADAYDFEEDTTPTLEFTGDAVSNEDLEYEIQIDTVNTFNSDERNDDGYSESNYDTDAPIGDFTTNKGIAQSFTAQSSSILKSLDVYLKKISAPTGNAVAKLYYHGGNYGSITLSAPIGDVLAISDTFDVSTLTTSYETVTFNFPTFFELEEGTYYFISIEYTGDSSNYLEAKIDTSSPTHSGVIAALNSSNEWYGTGFDYDLCFQLKVSIPLIQALSEVPDAGFLNTTDNWEATTYYFDGSDAAAVDSGTDWVDVTNSDDGSISTYAYIPSGTSILKIEGTNAPASGNTITLVRTRIYYDDDDNDTPHWSSYYNLSIPSGGWTWAKVQALESSYLVGGGICTFTVDTNGDAEELLFETFSSYDFRVYKVEIEVITGDWHPFDDNEKVSYTVQPIVPSIIETFYFDGSDLPAEDQGSDWVNVTNLDDGSISTYMYTTSLLSSAIWCDGTNAPSSGSAIVKVRTRIYVENGQGNPLLWDIWDETSTELLTYEDYPIDFSLGWTDYVNVLAPIGGWTWAGVQGLSLAISSGSGSAGQVDVYKMEIEVTSLGPLPAPTGTDVYYWRARAKNPTGINIWDDWSFLATPITTYYFDGSDAGAVDTDAVWTDETNTDDGSTSTYGYTTTLGSETTNEVIIEGTNAPASGADIFSVRARYYANFSGGDGWSDYVELSIPSGGWTWAKLQALEAITYYTQQIGEYGALSIYTNGLGERLLQVIAHNEIATTQYNLYKIELEVTPYKTFELTEATGTTTTTTTVGGGINIKVNIGDDWKEATAMKINIGDDWKEVITVKQNIGGIWKTVF